MGDHGRKGEKFTDPTIEEQVILRAPPAVADGIRKMLKGKANAPSFSFEMESDRQGFLYHDNKKYTVTLVDLPCIIESHKTIDRRTYYKSADIHQMLLVEDPDATEEGEKEKFKARFDTNWHLDSGITRPTRHIVKKKWRRQPHFDVNEVRKVAEELGRAKKGSAADDVLELVEIKAPKPAPAPAPAPTTTVSAVRGLKLNFKTSLTAKSTQATQPTPAEPTETKMAVDEQAPRTVQPQEQPSTIQPPPQQVIQETHLPQQVMPQLVPEKAPTPVVPPSNVVESGPASITPLEPSIKPESTVPEPSISLQGPAPMDVDISVPVAEQAPQPPMETTAAAPVDTAAYEAKLNLRTQLAREKQAEESILTQNNAGVLTEKNLVMKRRLQQKIADSQVKIKKLDERIAELDKELQEMGH